MLIIADVHGNLPALEAVLADAGPVDEIWSLGDLVGYGPYPNGVVQLLRTLPFRSLAGNHDWGATGQADLVGLQRRCAGRLPVDRRAYWRTRPANI